VVYVRRGLVGPSALSGSWSCLVRGQAVTCSALIARPRSAACTVSRVHLLPGLRRLTGISPVGGSALSCVAGSALPGHARVSSVAVRRCTGDCVPVPGVPRCCGQGAPCNCLRGGPGENGPGAHPVAQFPGSQGPRVPGPLAPTLALNVFRPGDPRIPGSRALTRPIARDLGAWMPVPIRFRTRSWPCPLVPVPVSPPVKVHGPSRFPVPNARFRVARCPWFPVSRSRVPVPVPGARFPRVRVQVQSSIPGSSSKSKVQGPRSKFQGPRFGSRSRFRSGFRSGSGFRFPVRVHKLKSR